jgi:hypothetical protein
VLAVGEEAAVPLAGGGAMGYRWTWDVTGEADALCVSLRAAAPQASPQVAAADLPPCSGSRDQLLIIRGRTPGHAVIHLRLTRSFQPQLPPRETHTITVTIT